MENVNVYESDEKSRRSKWLMAQLAMAAALAGCGGGGGGDAPSPSPNSSPAPSEPAAVTSVAAASYTEVVKLEAFNRINGLRSAAGIGLLRQDASLDLAAQAHADYQVRNYTIGHGEISGQPGFTGDSPWARAAAAGYTSSASAANVGEVINYTLDDGTTQIDDLMSTPYHRYPLMQFAVLDLGVGRAVSTTHAGFASLTVNMGRRMPALQGAPSVPFVVWPLDGSTGVRTRMVPESPDPIPENNGSPAGYTVSVQVNEALRTLEVSSFTLIDASGSMVPVKLLTRATDANLNGLGYYAAIVPRTPLAANTTYTATVVGSYRFANSTTSAPINKTWSFTTGAN